MKAPDKNFTVKRLFNCKSRIKNVVCLKVNGKKKIFPKKKRQAHF